MRRKMRGALGLFLILCLAGGLLGCKGGKASGTPVARLGEETIDLEEAVFYTRMLQEQWELSYSDSYGEDLWQSKPMFGESTASTMEEALKQDVMDTLTEIHLLCVHAKEYGAELDKEERKTIARRAAAFIEDNTPAVLEAAGATRESVERFLTYNEQAAKTAQALKDSYEPDIGEDEARVGKLTYCLFSVTGTYDVEGNQTPFTEEELIRIREDAERFALRAQELSDITAAGEEISHTVIDVYFSDDTDGGAHELVAQTARELPLGGVSDIIETQEGYYIVQRVSDYEEEASMERLEELKFLARENYCDEMLKAWGEETPLEIIEEVWDEVRLEGLITKPVPAQTDG